MLRRQSSITVNNNIVSTSTDDLRQPSPNLHNRIIDSKDPNPQHDPKVKINLKYIYISGIESGLARHGVSDC
jgi:hypothetical protein